MVRGTAKYMSPEQARGIAVDARSDIFSLGSVMYELFTGRAAFEGDTASDVIAEILKAEPKPPAEFAPEVPPEIERIIAKALCKDRDARYQSVGELLADLQDFKKEAEFQAKLQSPAGVQLQKIASDRITPARALSIPSGQASCGAWPVVLAGCDFGGCAFSAGLCLREEVTHGAGRERAPQPGDSSLP